MEYQEEVEKSWQAFHREHGDGMGISAADLLKWDKPRPRHGDTWGNWQYDAEAMIITFIPEDYEIDLEECTTSAETMDRIFQLCKKTWLTAKDGGDMLQALNDLLDPQANLCSFGQDKKFDVTKHLKKWRRIWAISFEISRYVNRPRLAARAHSAGHCNARNGGKRGATRNGFT